MVDVFNKEKRSAIMRAVRGCDTTPEVIVRKIVRQLGYSFKTNVKSLPGIPDIVMTRKKKIIFVHGCFWHRHRCKSGQSTPAARSAYWTRKFEKNKNRDAKVKRKLRRIGWDVLIIWECETFVEKRKKLADKLKRFCSKTKK